METFFIQYLMPILGSFLAIVGTYIATVAAQWMTKKLGMTLKKEQEDAIEKAITEAVWSAEEKGAAILKESGYIPAATKNMKYNTVLNFALKRFPSLTKEEADRKIHGILGKTFGIGATSDPVPCVTEEKKTDVNDEKNWKIVPDDLPVVTP